MSVELWTLDGTDDEVEELIALFRLTLGAMQEAEVMHPETVSSLRKWCRVEWDRLHPRVVHTLSREQEIRMGLQRSPWWSFWESLEAGQEVRWTGTKSATYFVVDPNPVSSVPGSPQLNGGAYIELRRHSGKTFWTHIGQVRPLEPA